MIAIVGSSGTLGRMLLEELPSGDEPIRAVARHPRPDTGKRGQVKVTAADVGIPADAERVVQGARVVVSAITGFAMPNGVRTIDDAATCTLIRAAARSGVEHFILLSVARAAADAPIELFRAKYAAEQALRSSGMSWTIIRPTAYQETWLGILGGPLVREGRTMVFGRAENPINFVSALDVARFVRLAITDPGLRGRVLEVPGPENLTMLELVRLAESASGRTGTVTHVPRVAMRMLSVLLRPVNSMRAGQMAAALMMDTDDMRIDGPAMRATYPGIPMTLAAEVARRMFRPQAAGAAPEASPTIASPG